MTAPSREEVEARLSMVRASVANAVERGIRIKPEAVGELADFLTALLARLSEVEKALDECATDLSERVEAQYASTKDNYPSEKRRYDRDIAPALAARKLLAQHKDQQG